MLGRLRRPVSHWERRNRPVPALIRGINRVLHPHRYSSLDLDAIVDAILDEDEDEPLPLYTQWAIDAEYPPPAYAPPPTGPPPGYAETLRHDLLGTPAAAPSPPPRPGLDRSRHVPFGNEKKPRRPRPAPLRPAPATLADGNGRLQRPPTPRPRSPAPLRQQGQRRQSQQLDGQHEQDRPRGRQQQQPQQEQQQRQQEHQDGHPHRPHQQHQQHHFQVGWYPPYDRHDYDGYHHRDEAFRQHRRSFQQQLDELWRMTPAQRVMRGKRLRAPPKIAGTMRSSHVAAAAASEE
ncbi:hypothetical protein VTH06DRAFT_8705 [Thermothelomyces fergusii]